MEHCPHRLKSTLSPPDSSHDRNKTPHEDRSQLTVTTLSCGTGTSGDRGSVTTSPCWPYTSDRRNLDVAETVQLGHP